MSIFDELDEELEYRKSSYIPDDILKEFADWYKNILPDIIYSLMLRRFKWKMSIYYRYLPKERNHKKFDDYSISYYFYIENQKKETRDIVVDLNIYKEKISFNADIFRIHDPRYDDYEIDPVVYAYKKYKEIFILIEPFIIKYNRNYWVIEIDRYDTNQKNALISFIKNLFEKILNDKEIIEVLNGEKWLKGYSPPGM